MLRKILAVLILLPLAILIVALAVANREVVTVTFDPFGGNDPALALRAPLFVLVFIFVLIGVIIGGVAAWLNQRKWRRAARRFEREAAVAGAEADRLRHDLAIRDTAAPLSLRPPAA
jgi:uncharacterized integral membrane protein